MQISIKNPALPLIKEIRETRSIDEAAELISSGDWIMFSAAGSPKHGYLFSVGRIN